MWTCPRCGERHEDQFKECWKCFETELDEHVTAAPPKLTPPAPPRRLRSPASVLFRAAVGFAAGMLIGMAAFHRGGVSLRDAAIVGAVIGAVAGTVVGILMWVVFPFEPTAAIEPPDEPDG
jgi:hypothetical protein